MVVDNLPRSAISFQGGTTVLPTPPPLAQPVTLSPQAMPGLTLMQAHSVEELPNFSESQVKVSIETITPEEATAYLKANFKANRDKIHSNINSWALDMKQGRWKLSTDCIAFDVEGRLINGQNRLSAVEKANTPIQFLVARNFPTESINVLDLGKKRMMHERITIGGIPMMAKDCSVIRNAMCKWESRTLGTQYFSKLRHDSVVVKAFSNHNFYLMLMEKYGYMKSGIPSFFICAALMVYAEGLILASRRHGEYIEPLKRSLQFLEIAITGALEHSGTFKGARDGAALVLHRKHAEFKHKRKHWATWESYVITMKLAKKFESQEKPNHVVGDGYNHPFAKGDITNYQPTNPSLLIDLIDTDYVPEKIKDAVVNEIDFYNATK